MKKYIIPGIILLFVVVALGLTLYLVKQRQEQRSKAAPSTTVYFSPATVSKAVGETFSVDVMVTTGENTLTAAELHINYPSNFQGISFDRSTGNTFLRSELVPGSVGNGTASITLGSGAQLSTAKGTGSIATLTLKVLTASQSPLQITVDESSQISGFTTVSQPMPDETGNLISVRQPATVTITGGSTVTATNTPTPTQAAGATATPTPTQAAGATATPTKTPTPTTSSGATATPTPTQAAGATATPTKTPTPTTSSGATATPTPTTANIGGTTTTASPTPTTAQTSTPDTSKVLQSITNGQTVSTSTPTISGKAAPNSKVIITIQSEVQTISVTADASGNWTAKPNTPLEAGNHTLIVSATNTAGSTVTETVNFTVGLPSTASFTPTVLMAVFGLLLLVAGLKLAL